MLGAASSVTKQPQACTETVVVSSTTESEVKVTAQQPPARPKTRRQLLLLTLAVAIGGGVVAILIGTSSAPLGTTSTNSTGVTESSVIFTLRAAGSVSDYTMEVRAGLASAFASEIGLTASAVTVDIMAGSVIITVSIVTPVVRTESITSQLQTILRSPAAATDFLAAADTSGFAIVVTEILAAPREVALGAEGALSAEGTSPSSPPPDVALGAEGTSPSSPPEGASLKEWQP